MFAKHTPDNADKATLGYLILGPLFGLVYIVLLPLIGVMTILLALPELALAKKASAPDRTGMCLTCHSSKDLAKVFGNGERMSVFVNGGSLRASVHAGLSCNDCHQKISMASHPGRGFASRDEFARDAARSCRTCHSDAQLRMKPNHALVVNGPNAPPCTECHGAHTVKTVPAWKQTFTGNAYCLTCHQQKISKTHQNGEVLSLRIDPSNLASSVHGGHACSDCHGDFTTGQHPVRQYASGREHAIAVSGVCSTCHEEKTSAVRESIHYRMMTSGNRMAPVCTDCHGFHSVGAKETYDTASGTPCRKCHEGVFSVYTQSVHGMARAKGEHRAPLCASCHFAHEVQSAAVTEKIRDACMGCHPQAQEAHRQWLPNADLHLSAVACAACHAPDSGKGIYLKLHDEATGEPFTEEQLSRILGTRIEDLSGRLSAHGEGLDSTGLWALVSELNEKGADAKVTFLGSMEVSNGLDAHSLASKGYAIRDCESCHSQGSAFFKDVTVAVVKANGQFARYQAKPEVLASIFSFLPIKQFYVLGSTRLKLFDWIGIAMVFGGISVPILHLTARFLTSPIREAKRLNSLRKGGKK